MDLVFSCVPEFYLETLVDCFHVLRKSDPPFIPTGMFIKQGLGSFVLSSFSMFVSFVVTHFSDPRISSPELRDLLLPFFKTPDHSFLRRLVVVQLTSAYCRLHTKFTSYPKTP
ncbi:hypothetical protein Hanom_Chr08g00728341 [Helianthus anomalus]